MAEGWTCPPAEDTGHPRPHAAVRETGVAFGTLVLVALAVAAVYRGTLYAPFIFDDRTAILDNASIVRLWPLIGDAATRGPLNPPPLAPTARRPLPNLTLALNYRLGGLDPVGYHVLNLALHVLCAAVLAALVRRTLRLPYFGGVLSRAAAPLAAVVALVWAMHPLVTEAVVYVTQRTELLAALFYMTTLWAALRGWTAGAGTASAVWVAVAVLASWLGMASKEVVVSVPLAVGLYQRTFLHDAAPPAGRTRALYAGLVLGWAMLALLSAWGVSGLADPRHQVSLPVWWMTQAKVALLYLKLAVWPWPLSIHYAPAFLRSVREAWPWLVAAAMVGLAVVLAVRDRPAARFVVAVIAMTLAPTLLVPLPKMMVAERRMYLPLAGLVTLAVVGGWRTLAPRRASGALAAAALLIVVLGAVSARRLSAYASAVSIWEDAVLHQSDDPMSHYNLGVALLDAHRPGDALPAFERTLALEPDHTMALDNLGATLDRLGRPADALAPLENALRLDPDDGTAHNNLGAALLKLRRPAEAVPHLRRGLELMGNMAPATVYMNLGRALLETGHADEGLALLAEAVGRAPENVDALYSFGTGLLSTGKPADALPHLTRAIALAPDDAQAHNNLATALLQTGKPAAAVEHYRRALTQAPDDEQVHNNLGVALLDLGRTAEAIEELERALALAPAYASAHHNLGRALLASDRPAEAAAEFREAVRLDPADGESRFQVAIAYARSGARAAAVATAKEAIAAAHAQGGDEAMVRRIEAWLAQYARE